MKISIFDAALSREIAQTLLDVEAIKLRPNDPFTWASGWKSPIYCDNRVSLSYPSARTKIKDGLVRLIQNKFPDVEAIAGVATAGIPQGALLLCGVRVPLLEGLLCLCVLKLGPLIVVNGRLKGLLSLSTFWNKGKTVVMMRAIRFSVAKVTDL